MDAIYLIVLIAFGVMSAALLRLCAALSPTSQPTAVHMGVKEPVPARSGAASEGCHGLD